MNQKRIRDYGIIIGSYPTGSRNAITDIEGVTVGHCTIDTDTHKTGVTVIRPSKDNIYTNKLVAASYVLNGFGKTIGLLQIDELGTLESPIALTNTLNVGLVSDALITYTIEQCKKENVPVCSFNPVVGECNDSALNDIGERAVKERHVLEAFETASADFAQGDVGAGKGTICFGFKGGIGSSSRKITIDQTDYHIGVLVQSNFGKTKDFILNGAPLGETLQDKITPSVTDKGSIISVIATDLPLSSRQLKRLLKRTAMGLGRCGSHVGHGSGDIMIGFSTANVIKHDATDTLCTFQCINENLLDDAFHAVIEAEEEAILNSMIAADTVVGYTGEIRYGLAPLVEEYLAKL